MDSGPLVAEEIDAGAQLLREFEKYAPVRVAFWLKESEESRRYLYVASEQITDENIDLIYGEVGRITDELPDPWLLLSRVKAIGADHPLAEAALELRRRFRGKAGRLYGDIFGGVSVDDVYVYPSPIPAAVV